jgi:uncharacterized protein (TIGR00290 family)
MSNRAVSLWSGGKDSHLAFIKAKEHGYSVELLLSFFEEVSRQSMSHRMPFGLLRDQARLVNVPLQEAFVTRQGYEGRLRSILKSLVQHGITHVVAGDIYLQEHRDWLERVCGESGVAPVFPLWGMPVEEVFEEQSRFQSVIVSIDERMLSADRLGTLVDAEFRRALEATGLDICGEKGEYHTLVLQSPAMRGSLHLSRWKLQRYDMSVGLDVLEWSCVPTVKHQQEVLL